MTVTYLGHSCFKIEYEGASLIIDPYQNGSVPGLANLNESANVVLCSHGHFDHNAAELINIVDGDSPFNISCFETYHDDVMGAKRGMTKVHIVEAGGVKLVHMGDIGCMLNDKQESLLKYTDILLIPVGGYYTIDAAQAAELTKRINPKTVIPMHYRSCGAGFDEISEADGFLRRFDKCDILYSDSRYIPANHKVVVLKPEYQIL